MTSLTRSVSRFMLGFFNNPPLPWEDLIYTLMRWAPHYRAPSLGSSTILPAMSPQALTDPLRNEWRDVERGSTNPARSVKHGKAVTKEALRTFCLHLPRWRLWPQANPPRAWAWLKSKWFESLILIMAHIRKQETWFKSLILILFYICTFMFIFLKRDWF